MQVGGTTTFSQIYQQTKAGGQFKDIPGEKHLRLSTAGDLHTHRTDKRSGIHFLARAEKHKQAAEAIKAAIDTEVGIPGVGARVFERLGLGKKVKLSDLTAIKQQISNATDDVTRKGVLDKAKPLKGEYGAAKAQFLHAMGQLPSVRNSAKPMANENMGNDYFRSNVNDADKSAALDKLGTSGAGSLDAREAAGAIRGMFYEPVASMSKLGRLINHEAVSDAVGYYTGNNTLTETPVAKDAVPGEDSTAAALRLKQAIDRSLSPSEKAALKQRIDFMVDVAPLMTDKVGLCNRKPEDAHDQDKLWMKSMSVSYPLFLGYNQEDANRAIGGSIKEAGNKGRDFITALAIHRDIIFG
jgi:hypothetical protein